MCDNAVERSKKWMKYFSEEQMEQYEIESKRIENRPIVRIEGFSLYSNRYDLVKFKSLCHKLNRLFLMRSIFPLNFVFLLVHLFQFL